VIGKVLGLGCVGRILCVLSAAVWLGAGSAPISAPSMAWAALAPVDASPLGDRTPLLLIHGNGSEDRKDFGWTEYLARAGADAELSALYKTYLFDYDSKQRNLINGVALGDALASVPELAGRDVVMLAHSRGGVVARYMMNLYALPDGRPAGERVRALVTLGTPHRGSPGADPVLTLYTLDHQYDGETLPFLTRFYDSIHKTDTDLYLLWDDADNRLTQDVVCWDHGTAGEICQAPYSKFSDIRHLNRIERYRDRIYAYGANVYNGRPVGEDDLDEITDDFDEWVSHEALGITSILMGQMVVIPQGYPEVPLDDSYRPFRANDGLVHLASALFLKAGSYGLFSIDGEANVHYDPAALDDFCQIARCRVLAGRVDHLELLDNGDHVVNYMLEELKALVR